MTDDEEGGFCYLYFFYVFVKLQSFFDVEGGHNRAYGKRVDHTRKVPGVYPEVVLGKEVEEIREGVPRQWRVFYAESQILEIVKFHMARIFPVRVFNIL